MLTYSIRPIPEVPSQPTGRLVLAAIVLYCIYLVVVLFTHINPLPDPHDVLFVQGTCDHGVDWYGDPMTMSHRLDCSLAHYPQAYPNTD